MHIEYDKNRPIYLQIIEKIKSKIIYGELSAGERLPAILDMAVQMDVNQNTICRVYRELESEGLMVTKRGLGSFLVEDEDLIKKLAIEMSDSIIIPAIESQKRSNFRTFRAERLRKNDILKNYRGSY